MKESKKKTRLLFEPHAAVGVVRQTSQLAEDVLPRRELTHFSHSTLVCQDGRPAGRTQTKARCPAGRPGCSLACLCSGPQSRWVLPPQSSSDRTLLLRSHPGANLNQSNACEAELHGLGWMEVLLLWHAGGVNHQIRDCLRTLRQYIMIKIIHTLTF